MATSRRSKNTAPRPGMLVGSLATLGILLVVIAMVSAFAPGAFSRLTGQAAKPQPRPLAKHSETIEVTSADNSSVLRERYSVRLAPSKPGTRDSVAAPSGAAGQTQVIEKTAIPAPAAQSGTPQSSSTSPGSALPVMEAPFANELSVAKEFETLRQALLLDDAIQINIALNDFTSAPDDLEGLIRRIANVWMQRHDLMNAAVPALRTALMVKDPLGGDAGAIVSGSRTSATISTGIGSHVVAWSRWSRRELSDMWNTLAERSEFNPDLVLCAATAAWLSEDLLRSRTLAKKWTARAGNADSPLASTCLKLQTAVERWRGLLCWELAQAAMERGDSAEQARCVVELKVLQQLGNTWVAPMVARLTAVSPAESIDSLARKRDDGTAIKPSASAFPQFPDARLTGAWEATAKGARFPKGGAMEFDATSDASTLCVVITPQKLQGVIRIAAAPNEIVLDLDHAVLLVKGPSAAPQSIPITVYPRYENKITVRFGTTTSLGSLVLNHDQQILLAPSNWHPKKVTITAPQDLSLLVNAITLER